MVGFSGHCRYLYPEMSQRITIVSYYLSMLLCVTLPFLHAQGQHIEGIVYDKQTREIIRGTSIMLGDMHTITGTDGRFILPLPTAFPTTITATHIGYESTSITLMASPDTLLHIYLISKTIGLDEVAVLGRRNRIQDSLRMREEFAGQFNFERVKVWDAVMISPVGVAINLNMLFAVFSREQRQSKRLKAALIRDEKEDYVDSRFTKALVREQTNLSDEELTVFHWYFRPSFEQLVDFTEYDLLMYIREKYCDFTTRREDYPPDIPLLSADP